MNLDDNKLYKSAEVARMLNVTPTTLKNYFLSGKIEAITVNTHRYYTKEQILKYLNRHRCLGGVGTNE